MSKIRKAAVSIAVTVMAVPLIWMMSRNIIWLSDTHNIAERVAIENSIATSNLTRLPFDIFVGYVNLEGSVVVYCRDETIARGGYVTPNMGGHFSVSKDCELSVN